MKDIQFNYKSDFINSNTLLGIYRGLVVANRDPANDNGICKDKKIGEKFGRIKVFIPAIMKPSDDPTFGIWALPANNSIGGRNHNKLSLNAGAHPYQKYYGSCMIPAIGSYVFIFFEGGDPNRPFYFGACDLVEEQVPPENRLGTQWQNKWTIFRSLDGRTIIISDDPDDERTEITGKKRINPEDISSNVYNIIDNQKVILLDDREGRDKILIKDNHGNYINIHTKDNKLHIYFSDDINIKTDKNMYITCEEDLHIKSKNLFIETEENTDIIVNKELKMNVKEDTYYKYEKNVYSNIKMNKQEYIEGVNLEKVKNDKHLQIEEGDYKIEVDNGDYSLLTRFKIIFKSLKDSISFSTIKNFIIDALDSISISTLASLILNFGDKKENEAPPIPSIPPSNLNDEYEEILDPEEASEAEPIGDRDI